MTVYEFEVQSLDGKPIKLDIYRGRVLLIVNLASKCSFTPQYEGLEALYKKYFDRGFEVLGFPCNQFLWQEPGDGQECRLKYNVTFPVFEKIRVNGQFTHPLYRFLKDRCRGYLWTKPIMWNFTKFLVDRHGKPVKRYSVLTPPLAIEPHIAELLEEPWPK